MTLVNLTQRRMRRLSFSRLCDVEAAPNNGMHPTADTLPVIYFQRLGAAGDAWRYAAALG